MSMKRIRRLSVLLVILLLSGCGLSDTPVPPGGGKVSSDTNLGYYALGLRVENGDLKESGAVFEDGPVAFQDPVIEEMLRTILGKPDGEVLRSELQSIHAIYWRSGNRYWSDLQSPEGKVPRDGSEWIVSGQPQTLADLAYCDNLQWLEIGAVELPSLEPLCSLTQLSHITFGNTTVSAERWEELVRLPALTGLELDFRDVSSDHTGATTGADSSGDGSCLLPIAQKLTYLCINHRFSWDTDVLAQFTNLECLYIDTPKDLSFLESMPKLWDLTISNHEGADWSILGQMPSLRCLELFKCKDITLEELAAIEDLEQLLLVMCEPTYQRQEQRCSLPFPLGWSSQDPSACPIPLAHPIMQPC